jgi:ribulose 1,5-bisphosphate carboxylase large subunit-like protein
MTMQLFERYIGIDYSSAETPTSSLKGLRVYMADWKSKPVEDSWHQMKLPVASGWGIQKIIVKFCQFMGR